MNESDGDNNDARIGSDTPMESLCKLVNLSSGVRVKGSFHAQNVNVYHCRLHQWLDRFHGVATRYLPNYLGCQRALDTHLLTTPETFLRAAIGVFHTQR